MASADNPERAGSEEQDRGWSDAVVFIVDDDWSVRESLSSLIESVGLKVATFGTASEFMEAQKPDCPACLLLDLELPDASGLELQAELSNLGGPAIVFITGYGDIPSSVRAMKGGAVEFLCKPFSPQDLLNAIESAIALDRGARKQRSELAELRKRYALLTPREREVLPFVVSGFANKETAADLGISVMTIGVHRGQIMTKMGARSLAGLVRMADRLNISYKPGVSK